jgi:hypothetical protein
MGWSRETTTPTAIVMLATVDCAIELVPVRSVERRAVAVALLSAFSLFHAAPWYQHVFFAGGMTLWLGSFRRQWIANDMFVRETTIAFVRTRTNRWKLDHFVRIETAGGGITAAFFMGPMLWAMYRFLDWVVPWLGGDYKLHLRTDSGCRVLAWQGNVEEYFKENLDLLRNATNLPVERGIDIFDEAI